MKKYLLIILMITSLLYIQNIAVNNGDVVRIEEPTSGSGDVDALIGENNYDISPYYRDVISHDADGDGTDEIYFKTESELTILKYNGQNYSITQTLPLVVEHFQNFDYDNDGHEEMMIFGYSNPTYNDLVVKSECSSDCFIPDMKMYVYDSGGSITIGSFGGNIDWSNSRLVKLNGVNYIITVQYNQVVVYQFFSSNAGIIDSVSIIDVTSALAYDYDDDGIEELVLINNNLSIYSFDGTDLALLETITDPSIDIMEGQVIDLFGNGSRVVTVRVWNEARNHALKYLEPVSHQLITIYNASVYGLYAFGEGCLTAGNFTNISTNQIVLTNRESVYFVYYNSTSHVFENTSASLSVNTYNNRINRYMPNTVNGITHLLYAPLSDFSFVALYEQDTAVTNYIKLNNLQTIPFTLRLSDSIKGDFNQDGFEDVITGHYGGQVSVFLNNGTHLNMVYQLQMSNSSVRTSSNPTVLTVIERNQIPVVIASHGPDLVAYHLVGQKLEVLSQVLIGTLFPESSRAIRYMTPYNVDQIGVEEIAVNTFQHGLDDGSFAVFNFTDSGFVLLYHQYLTTPYLFYYDSELIVFDYNSDGISDIIMLGRVDSTVYDYDYVLTVLSFNNVTVPFTEELVYQIVDPQPYSRSLSGKLLHKVMIDSVEKIAILTPALINGHESMLLYSYVGNHIVEEYDPIQSIFSMPYIGTYNNEDYYLRRNVGENTIPIDTLVTLSFNSSTHKIEYHDVGSSTFGLNRYYLVADIISQGSSLYGFFGSFDTLTFFRVNNFQFNYVYHDQVFDLWTHTNTPLTYLYAENTQAYSILIFFANDSIHSSSKLSYDSVINLKSNSGTIFMSFEVSYIPSQDKTSTPDPDTTTRDGPTTEDSSSTGDPITLNFTFLMSFAAISMVALMVRRRTIRLP